MRRVLGTLLILHGLAHMAAGMWVYGADQRWPVTALWLVATLGFFAAGIGLFGVPRLEKWWHPIVATGATASLALLALYEQPNPVLVTGSGIDGVLLIGSIPFAREVVARALGVPVHPPHRRLSALGAVLLVLVLAYPIGLIAVRPWRAHSGETPVPSFVAVPLAPLDVMLFEPARFIAHHRALNGTRELVERIRHWDPR